LPLVVYVRGSGATKEAVEPSETKGGEKDDMPKKKKRIAKATLMLAVMLLALVVAGGGTAFAQALAIGGAIQC
jgi:hypothetical protein